MRAKTVINLLLFLSFSFFAHAQCGLDVTSGTTTIGTLQVINSYYPGQGSPVINDMSLSTGVIDGRGNATILANGDLILIMQMQGADINTANSNAYGDGVAGGNASGYLSSNLQAGNYEYNSVASISGGTINLAYPLANNYYTRDFSGGAIQRYQVIRIPRLFDVTISLAGTVTCPPWNGNTGGVVVMDAANVLTVNGIITASGLGFRGGGAVNYAGATAGNTNGSTAIANTDFRWNSPTTTPANTTGGSKGEGIAGTPRYTLTNGATAVTTNGFEGYTNGAIGRGAPANGGGGATDGAPSNNGFNPGGGGGGNGGTGGRGGSGWHGGSGDVNSYATGGYGGSPYSTVSATRFIMGGGGGAGSANNSDPTSEYLSSGAAGGGIILLRAKSYAGSGSIQADGADAYNVIDPVPADAFTYTDAAGGGGAGGTIVAVTRQNVTVGLTGISASAHGGKGGNMETYFDHGPGGGGGGGVIITNGAFASTTLTGGANGLTRTTTSTGTLNNVYGSAPGTVGLLTTLPVAPALKNVNNVASPCGTLPITLESFTAVLNGNAVLLNWDVSQAIDFATFEIEYSTDGANFARIGQVAFVPQRSSYDFTHTPVTSPVNYYRLKLVDRNGTARYSNILIVRLDKSLKGMRVYPQPAKDVLTVSVVARSRQLASFQLLNASGIKVKEERVQLNNGNNTLTIQNLQGFAAGLYTLKTVVDGTTLTSKVMIAGK